MIIKLAEKELQKKNLSEKERFERAIKKLSQSISKKKLCSLDEALLRSQRATYYASGPSLKFEEAIKDLRRVDELNALSIISYRYHYKSYDLLLHLLFETSQYDELESILQGRIEGRRRLGKWPHASLFYRLAIVKYFQGNYELAREHIETAINTDGFTDEIVFLPLMEATYTKLNQPQAALSVFQRYAKRHPSDAYIQQRIQALIAGDVQKEVFGKEHVSFLGIRSRIRRAFSSKQYLPVYPEACMTRVRSQKDSRVEVGFNIGVDGKAYGFEFVPESNKCFHDVASKAIAEWKFEPALLNGKPIEELGARLTYVFRLDY